jgi:hypothetical protein
LCHCNNGHHTNFISGDYQSSLQFNTPKGDRIFCIKVESQVLSLHSVKEMNNVKKLTDKYIIFINLFKIIDLSNKNDNSNCGVDDVYKTQLIIIGISAILDVGITYELNDILNNIF